MEVRTVYENLKTKLTKRNMELGALVAMALCAISVFTASIPTKGTLTLDNGKIVYDGSLVRGKMNGQGTVTFENGDKYEGTLRNGAFDGQGTFTSAEGWKYEGHFANGQADGRGTLTTQANVVYEGEFKQGIYQHAN